MRKIEDFNDALITTACNVAGLIRIKDSFYDTHKLDWFGKCCFSERRWYSTDWNDVKLTLKGEAYILKRTLISKEYVDKFIKIAKIMTLRTNIDVESLNIYESEEANHPILITFQNIGMIIAPRLSDDDKYGFKNLEEKDVPCDKVVS